MGEPEENRIFDRLRHGGNQLIALVISAERALCPFVELYISVLDQFGCDYFIVEWDRMHTNDTDELSFRTRRTGPQRGLPDYLKYACFVKKVLRKRNADTVIVFGLPTLFALGISGTLNNRIYGIDIRDYHKSYQLPLVQKTIKRARFLAISSPGFKTWLPRGIKTTISHNAHDLTKTALVSGKNRGIGQGGRRIVVGTIGQLKDLDVNKTLVRQLGNNERILLVYHGEGVIEEDLKAYCTGLGLNNIRFTGRYQPSQEPDLYSQCDTISMLMTPGTINNNTLMANRVYNSALYGVPLIVFSGTYLAEIVSRYCLGIIVDSPDDLNNLDSALESFLQQSGNFERGRAEFKKWVVGDQKKFQEDLLSFASLSMTSRELQ